MSRCKCCDIKLPYISIVKTKHGERIEDMCTKCRSASYDFYKYTADHEYQFEGLKEGVTDPVHSGYDGEH